MSVTLTGTGGLFTRLGKIGLMINAVNAFRGTSGSPNVGTMIDAIEAQFASADQDMVDGLYRIRNSYRTAHGSALQDLRTLAQAILIDMVHDDANLPTRDLPTAMKELIRQMVANGDSIEKPTVTVASAAGGSNIGSGQMVCSVKNPYGVVRDYPFAEVIDLECAGDSQQGQTSGREPFSVKGAAAESDSLSWYWPRGSGASASIQSVDATEDAGANKLYNSDFTDFTSNTPSHWTVLVGSAGTDIFSAGSSDALGSSGSALKFTGTGGTPLSAVAQTFSDSSGGTGATLKPNTVYHGGVWMKKSASLAAGVVEFSLVDSTPTILTDDATTNLSATFAHGTIATSYGFHSFSFVTPKNLPSTYKFRVRASTALTSGESVFIDHLSFAEASLVYAGGPYTTVHSHPTKFVLGDTFTLTVANSWATALWAMMLQRMFDMRGLGLQVPSVTGAAETVADSLLT